MDGKKEEKGEGRREAEMNKGIGTEVSFKRNMLWKGQVRHGTGGER